MSGRKRASVVARKRARNQQPLVEQAEVLEGSWSEEQDGSSLFWGGITGSRPHSGYDAGRVVMERDVGERD